MSKSKSSGQKGRRAKTRAVGTNWDGEDSRPILPAKVVGRLYQDDWESYVKPILSSIKREIRVTNPSGYPDSSIVEMASLKEDFLGLNGKVTGTLEGFTTAEYAINVALAALDLPVHFPPSVEQLEFPHQVDPKTLTGRRDLRDLPLVTIDGKGAQDFDDAVYAERLPSGHWRLVVAIADVAHYVVAGSELDQVARQRASSIYLPGQVIPMLPTPLSNGICSLIPSMDRLAIVCDLEVDTDGLVADASFYEAVIRSHARLIYDEVENFLNGGGLRQEMAVKGSLKTLQELSEVLIHTRVQRGALDLDVEWPYIQITYGEPRRAVKSERTFAHRMIEEAMILANQSIASFLTEHCVPLFRIHEPPREEAIEQLAQLLEPYGIQVPRPVEHAQLLENALEQLNLTESNRRFWYLQVIRSMQLARYSATNPGHFGLGLSHYVHFTSPIRRYADLYTHRQLKRVLRGELCADTTLEVEQLGKQQSETEYKIERVARHVQTWLLCELLRRDTARGTALKGIITGITEFGAFVELDDAFVTGLVHISDIGDHYFFLEGGRLVSETTKFSLGIGERVKVRLDIVDPALGRVNLKFMHKLQRRRA